MENNEGLSPNELAALEEDEDETESAEELEAGAGEEADAGAAKDEAVAAVAAENVPVADVVTETVMPAAKIDLTLATGDALEVPANLPVVRFQFRDDGQVLPEFAGQFAELDTKYEAGNLSLAQYNEQRDVLRAEMGNVKADSQLWQTECDTFYKHNPTWRNGPLADMLNGEVKRLAVPGTEQGLSGIEIIYAAQARVIKAIDAVRTPGVVTPPATATVTTQRPASPRPSAVTHALATMPAAAAAETGKGEFSHLDNLTGLDLERAVAGLSADQRERWAQEN